jgi:formate-dependent nitrite reductase cytochrome c552 subunit
VAADAKAEALERLPRRLMDCMDCHNRPTHTFQLPDPAVNQAIAAGLISPQLPFIKKTAVEALRKEYPSQEQASAAIPAAIAAFYKSNYPAVYESRRADIRRASDAVLAIYSRNVFPQMKVTWGTYPNHIGHNDFPGCFRCHDDNHASTAGRNIGQDCSSCHQILAMEETSPKVLTDLGLTN